MEQKKLTLKLGLKNMVKLYALVPQRLDGIWDIPYPIFTPPQRLHGCMKKMGYTGISQKNIATSRSRLFLVYGRWIGISQFESATSAQRHMGDDMEYPILKLPHRVLHIFWDIEQRLGYSGYWQKYTVK